MSGLLMMATSAISFISGICYTKHVYEEKEKAAATNRSKAEEIAKKWKINA
jgi:hypothetical protein